MVVPILAVTAQVAKRKLIRRLVRVLLVAAPLLIAGMLCISLLLVMLFTSGKADNAGGVGSNGCVSAVPASQASVAGLDRDQLVNAQTIVAVGRQMKVPAYGWVVAVATAMQESGLRNLDHGHLDSLGLFQQRHDGWGSDSQRMDAAASARMFYAGGQNGAPGLMQIQGWESMPMTLAAQAVQRSAFPDAYAKWQALATQVVGDPTVLSAVCTGGAGFKGDGSQGAGVFAAALKYLGTPYSWGGGGPNGPDRGFGIGATTVGFDCSSLVQYAWQQEGVALPRVADSQARATAHLPSGAPLRAGDLLFFQDPADSSGRYHHVGIYDGNGNMVHAPRTGKTVEVVHDVFSDPYYSTQFALATRPGGASVAAIGVTG